MAMWSRFFRRPARAIHGSVKRNRRWTKNCALIWTRGGTEDAERNGDAEARRAARVEMGSMAAVKEEIRGAGWEAAVEAFWCDFRYSVRGLAKAPVFTSRGGIDSGAGNRRQHCHLQSHRRHSAEDPAGRKAGRTGAGFARQFHQSAMGTDPRPAGCFFGRLCLERGPLQSVSGRHGAIRRRSVGER